MAFNVATGSFTVPTADTSDTDISSLGFDPKAVILFASLRASAGSVANIEIGYGFSDGTNEWSFSKSAQDGNNVAGKRIEASAIHTITGGSSPSVGNSGTLTLQTGGFVIDWTTVDTNEIIVHYVALGGDDLSAEVGFMEMETAEETQAETVSFEPDVLLFCGGHVEGSTPPDDDSWSEILFGAAIDASNEWASAGTAVSVSDRAQRSDRTILMTGATNSISRAAQFDSKDSSSFTLDWVTASSGARQAIWLALAGIDAAVGVFDQNSSTEGTGPQAVTGVGFEPDLLIFSGFGAASTTSVPDSTLGFFGAAVGAGANDEWVFSWGTSGGGTNSDKDTNLDQGSCILSLTGGPPTIDVEANLDSMDSDGFTIDNVTLGDTTNREVCYIALAGAGGGATEDLTSGMGIGSAVSDLAGYADDVESGIGVGSESTDLQGYAESTEGGMGIGVALTDLQGYAESVVAGAGLGSVVTDLQGYLESLESGMGIGVVVVDTTEGAENLVTGMGLGTVVTDLQDYADDVESGMGVGAAVDDLRGYVEILESGIGIGVAVTDSVENQENLVTGMGLGSTVSDLQTYLDDVESGIGVGSTIADSQTYLDALEAGIGLGTSLAEVYQGVYTVTRSYELEAETEIAVELEAESEIALELEASGE